MLSVENEKRFTENAVFNFSPFEILACGLSEPRTATF